MLLSIGANDFDVHISCADVEGYSFPFSSGQLNRVAGVGDYVDARIQNVGRNAIGQSIPLILDVNRAQLPQRLLDRINSQVSGTNSPCQQLGHCRLPAPRQPRQNVEGHVVQCRRTFSCPPCLPNATRSALQRVGSMPLLGADDFTQRCPGSPLKSLGFAEITEQT